jgi:hypothetical protein
LNFKKKHPRLFFSCASAYLLGALTQKRKSHISGMLEYFQRNRPDQWLDIVKSLMEISKRNYSHAQSLGAKLEYMIDDNAEFMGSEPEI